MKRTYEPREFTNKFLEMKEDLLLDKDDIILSLLNYMSDEDVMDWMEMNGYLEDDEED